MRVMLTEGSGLTSREVAEGLGRLGHEVELLSSAPLCLARFCRAVKAVHRVPALGADPLGWWAAARTIVAARRVDLLFPTHESVAVLSAFEDELPVRAIVPPFSALRRVQDKVSAAATLKLAGVPQPPFVILRSEREVAGLNDFPAFLKRPIGTASSGVRRVNGREELGAAIRALGPSPGELLVQTAVSGPLAMVQAVAHRGRLVAHHANLRVREGVGGGASTKESLPDALTRPLVERLVTALDWHGAISLDAVLTERGPEVIDVNPRLVEPGNALAAGVDLVDAMLSLAGPEPAPTRAPGRLGVRSHLLLLAVLEAARRAQPRRAVASELWSALRRRGAYASGAEELTPLNGAWSALPLLAVAAGTFLWPPSGRRFEAGSVGAYALSPEGWEQLVKTADARVTTLERRR